MLLFWNKGLFCYGGIQNPLLKQFIRGLSVASLLGRSEAVGDADVNSEEIK
jgi:hypothetical protein